MEASDYCVQWHGDQNVHHSSQRGKEKIGEEGDGTLEYACEAAFKGTVDVEVNEGGEDGELKFQACRLIERKEEEEE